VITIGKITKSVGKDGLLNVTPMTDFPERFCQLKRVTIADNNGYEMVAEVEKVHYNSKHVTLKLKGIDSIKGAERFRNMFLLIRPDEAFPLPQGHYYIFDIVGLVVMTESGAKVGEIQDVMKLESNDVYVVRSHRGEVLIPATKEIVRKIDVEHGRMVIHPVKGLLD
jgi:16S rRNA processing protein RimM